MMGSMGSSSARSQGPQDDFFCLVEKYCDGYVRGMANSMRSNSRGSAASNAASGRKDSPMKKNKSKQKRSRSKSKKNKNNLNDSIEIMDIAPERLPFVCKMMEEML
jgi:hypothetical protein